MGPGCIIEHMSYKSKVMFCALRPVKVRQFFCPKYQGKVFMNGVEKRLKAIIDQVAKELNREVIPALVWGASVPAQVRMLCKVDPQFGVINS